MARPGLFDPELRSEASFDPSLLVEGWYDPDFLGAGIVAPPAPPPVSQGGGTYLYRFPPSIFIPAVVEPRIYSHTGVISLGRLRIGGKVVFSQNRLQEEDEEIILLLELL